MAIVIPLTSDECCKLSQLSGTTPSYHQTVVTLLYSILSAGIPVSVVPGVVTLTPEATFPKSVAVGGTTDVTVLPANASRKPGSYIQNLSASNLNFNLGAAASGATGILPAGGVLSLGEGDFIYQGDVHVFNPTGGSVNVWAVSFA